MKIWALHGFLGQAADFGELEKICQTQDSALMWQSVDYMHSRELSPQTPLDKWGEHFVRMLGRQTEKDADTVLLGYSQGGRLALQALKKDPHLYKAIILISVNPGLPAAERSARKKNDEEWADAFLHHHFYKTVDRWNSQPVFQGSTQEPVRHESDFNRHQLADCLTEWSLSRQEDLRVFLKSVSVPILFISGERDTKYAQIGQSLKALNPRIAHEPIADAGHRVFMDQPALVGLEIMKFLRTI